MTALEQLAAAIEAGSGYGRCAIWPFVGFGEGPR